mmetsp:Transcript_49648/g.120436  ORF Transcript_49648/g.120436 Transcript_49648/m.120436 type:complete len:229 (+) Transcript_49648:66-752(+)
MHQRVLCVLVPRLYHRPQGAFGAVLNEQAEKVALTFVTKKPHDVLVLEHLHDPHFLLHLFDLVHSCVISSQIDRLDGSKLHGLPKLHPEDVTKCPSPEEQARGLPAQAPILRIVQVYLLTLTRHRSVKLQATPKATRVEPRQQQPLLQLPYGLLPLLPAVPPGGGGCQGVWQPDNGGGVRLRGQLDFLCPRQGRLVRNLHAVEPLYPLVVCHLCAPALHGLLDIRDAL